MRTRVHGRGIARYTWIIDFVHERATTGASKIPVALLIVVNCLLYTASFQMRFRRFPRAADKSNCDLSRYRCASCRQSYHSNRTFTRCPEFLNTCSVYVRALAHFFPPLVVFSFPCRFYSPFLCIYLFSLLSRVFSPVFHLARPFASYYYRFLLLNPFSYYRMLYSCNSLLCSCHYLFVVIFRLKFLFPVVSFTSLLSIEFSQISFFLDSLFSF